MKSGSEVSMKRKNGGENEMKMKNNIKPPFRPAQDDTKPLLQDPILRSDPTETEEAVLRLPPIPITKSKAQPQ